MIVKMSPLNLEGIIDIFTFFLQSYSNQQFVVFFYLAMNMKKKPDPKTKPTSNLNKITSKYNLEIYV